jgi:phytoene desaturase
VPADARRVVIVGAGLGGLSAALRLAGAGLRVSVIERDPLPGGRAGLLDTGPTVLTMPSLLADAFAAVDESLSDWLDLVQLDPAYRAFFPDGSQLDIVSDVRRMADTIADFAGPVDRDGYLRFADVVRRMFALELPHFIDRNLDSPVALLSTQLVKLAQLGGFRRLAPLVASFFRDPRLRRVFSFQALYAGLSPFDALGLYASIAYLDSIAGVWFPVGGMHAVPTAMAAAATKHDVEIHTDREVVKVEMRGSRATAVHTADGERITADAVVINAEPPAAFDLLGRHRPRRRIAHHNLHFGRDWRRGFRELDRGELMAEPSFLVTSPTRTDALLAPADRHSYYALLPVPNVTSRIDWDRLRPRLRDEMVARLEYAGYSGFGEGVEAEQFVTPADWARRGYPAGTPFSAAHTFSQTGPFRQPNLVAENVALAGCGTQPGSGVPMALISGRLAAERVLAAR